MSEPSSSSDWPQMIEDCQERESKMTEWEQGFISSIEAWLGQGKNLSEKQHTTLDKIWEKVTK